MLSMRQLDKAIDSIRRENNKFDSISSLGVFGSLQFVRYLDSNWTSTPPATKAKSFNELIPDSLSTVVQQSALSQITMLRSDHENLLTQYKEKQRDLRLHKIEWHRKLSLSLACLVLFLIGAPLGSIIRKGGLGSPLVFAIVFFMVFYFTSTTGEKFAKEGSFSPFTGMWFSTFVLVPIGIFLTYKAMRDSQLFNKEFYFRFWKKMQVLWARKIAGQKRLRTFAKE